MPTIEIKNWAKVKDIVEKAVSDPAFEERIHKAMERQIREFSSGLLFGTDRNLHYTFGTATNTGTSEDSVMTAEKLEEALKLVEQTKPTIVRVWFVDCHKLFELVSALAELVKPTPAVWFTGVPMYEFNSSPVLKGSILDGKKPGIWMEMSDKTLQYIDLGGELNG